MAHWYIIKDGVAQRYVQYNKDGTERKLINRKQAIADGAVLGLTDLLSYLGQPKGLLRWYGQKGVEAALSVVREFGVDDPDIDEKAIAKFDDVINKPADVGTDFHDAIDGYLATGVMPEDPAMATAAGECKRFLDEIGVKTYRTNHCLIYRQGDFAFGGTTDFVAMDPPLVLDFKTIERRGKSNEYRRPSWKECAQLAGYRMAAAQMALTLPIAKCYNLYFDRVTGAFITAMCWDEWALGLGEEMIRIAHRVSHYIDLIESANGD